MFKRILTLALTAALTASSSTILSAALLTSSPLTPAANAQSQQYRLSFWYTIDGSNDGFADNTVELYGDLMVNGIVRRRISRTSALSREAGANLKLVTIATSKSSVTIFANLMDRDSGSADDPVFRMDPLTLDLGESVGQTIPISWKSGGGEGATLYISVEKN
jgi:hypothetical protein